ncbi:hypothetical protein [Saccharothrix carnea]
MTVTPTARDASTRSILSAGLASTWISPAALASEWSIDVERHEPPRT